ncbi:UDP-3-O-(3-hydroxymyristoyl)glucosamine N-acyltransferase [Ideonella livida]|uniref:UDP-3-O-(3-hydroxymyristoyl)glucosamine N-acyltransferase n=1 Tax=Ideonella livida TaxID=2707176 RepID=UPI002872EA98|nr:UDP-3-O-(3-hydroxymyristoyl)glucosamine N-acyltransferase [Ideonella livida]
MRALQDEQAPLIADIAAELAAQVLGDAGLRIRRMAPLETAQAGELSFLANPKLKSKLATCCASAVIVRADAAEDVVAAGGTALIVADPYRAFAQLTRWWAARVRPAAAPGIHPSAVLGQGVRLGTGVSVGPLSVIEEGACLGDGVVIGPQCQVGRDAEIGAGSRLAARVAFGAECRMGQRGVLHSGAVIGADGFGFAPHQGRWEKIEQLGAVWMGDDVEVGANTCIDRGALEDTVLEDGVKLDNLIQIAHNVRIGAHTAMAGCVGVAGSARIGAHCTFGGAAMILGHLEIGDHVHISAASVVMSSILKPGQYSGVFPIDENGNWEKNAATLRQLHQLRSRLRAVEKKLTP